MRAVYAASERGALPAGVGSMCLSGIFGGLASLGLSISGERRGGCPMSSGTETERSLASEGIPVLRVKLVLV
jgi:hypothetical protein